MINRGFIFVAGPMSTSGEPGPNMHAAASAAALLLKNGFQPLIPHVTWILHAIRPDVPLELWWKWDRCWITKCDGVLRLDGNSVGADNECDWALQCGVPVFTGMVPLLEYFSERESEQRSQAAGPQGRDEPGGDVDGSVGDQAS